MIELPCFGIMLEVHGESGMITSDLKGGGSSQYSAAVDAVESMVLAHACAGIDVSSPAYITGIETAVFAIADELGDLGWPVQAGDHVRHATADEDWWEFVVGFGPDGRMITADPNNKISRYSDPTDDWIVK